MQVVKRAIKTAFLISIITVMYTTFLNKGELPFLFCVCYAMHCRSLVEVTIVSLVMGIVSCAFGRYGFLHGMFLCLYVSYIFMLFKPRKKPFLKNLALFFVCAIISLGQDFLYTTLFFIPFYFLTFKIYKEKEKYIFS